ncbi:MAG: TRAP transporter small permease [Alphaproteobacteria bacterium]|nr:TRAP transporter small permease [Alphaproteobacteria bacterium]
MDLAPNPHEPKGVVGRCFYLLAAASMITLTAVVLYVIVARYFFNAPPLWGEDVPRIIFIWGIFLACPLAICVNLNLRVTMLLDVMSARLRMVLEVAMHLMVLALLAVVFWYSLPLVRLGFTGTMLSTGWSNAVLRMPIAIGAALMFVAQLVQLSKSVRGIRY